MYFNKILLANGNISNQNKIINYYVISLEQN